MNGEECTNDLGFMNGDANGGLWRAGVSPACDDIEKILDIDDDVFVDIALTGSQAVIAGVFAKTIVCGYEETS